MNRISSINDPIRVYLNSYDILINDLYTVISTFKPSTLALIFGPVSCPNVIYALHKTVVDCNIQQYLLQILPLISDTQTSKFILLAWAPRGIESELTTPKRFKFKDQIDLVESDWKHDDDYVWYALNATLDACSTE